MTISPRGRGGYAREIRNPAQFFDNDGIFASAASETERCTSLITILNLVDLSELGQQLTAGRAVSTSV